MEKSDERTFQPGLTWRSALGIIFAVLVILPVNLFLTLAAGAAISMLVVTVLFTEAFALFGKQLTKQETYIIFVISWLATSAPFSFLTERIQGNFLDFVYRAYFINSVPVHAFTDPNSGLPLNYVVPNWWAPSYNSGAYDVRSFLHPTWVTPILLGYGIFLLYTLQEFSLTMISSQLYVEVEKLPFPYAQVDAQTCIILADRPPEQMRIFTFSALGGIIYGAVLYLLPISTAGAFSIIPIPWLDFTTGFFGIEKVMPGALLGIGTDITPFANGFLLPLHIVTYMLIGSVAIWVFGNWIALAFFPQVFPEWAAEWSEGMSLALIYQRSQVRVWLAPQIAFALAVAVIILIRGRRSVANAFKSLAKLSTSAREAGYLQLSRILALYIGSSLLSACIFHILVPVFPLWIIVPLSLGWGFINNLVASRGIAETGNPVSIPYLWQGMILASGYRGLEPWFVSPVMGGSSSPWWTNSVKTSGLVEMRPVDFFKSIFIGFALIAITSFIYTSFFWSIAPIPSTVYPMTLIQWPVNAITHSMWISGQITAINPQILLTFFAGMFIMLMLGEVLQKYTSIPFSAISLVVGATMLPTFAIPTFIGSVVGWLILQRQFGKEWWMASRAIISGGLTVGEGIIVAIGVAWMLISKGTWILPW